MKNGDVLGTLGVCLVCVLATYSYMSTRAAYTPDQTTEVVETEITETETPKEQKYIVRYATAIYLDSNGITTYEDTDGNLWTCQDAPTEIGYDARLLFDSNETFTETDDTIIDITEIN